MLDELRAEGVAAFGDRFKFGDGFLRAIVVRYDYDWPSNPCNQTVELLFGIRDLSDPSQPGGAWINLRLVFEQVREFRFSQPANNRLSYCSVGDNSDSPIGAVNG